MYALLILTLLLFSASALMRGVRTRRRAPLAVGSACMLADTLVIAVLSL
jgi:hypothetical protein